MKKPSPNDNQSAGPTTDYIVVAVLLTVVAGIVLFVIEVDMAEDFYRNAHALPDVQRSSLFSTWTEPAPVTLDMLGTGTILILFGIAMAYSILLHPLIGRGVSQAIQYLTKLVESVYRLHDEWWSNWNPGASLVVGAAWPITMLAIPLLLIALVIGRVYRALWRW